MSFKKIIPDHQVVHPALPQLKAIQILQLVVRTNHARELFEEIMEKLSNSDMKRENLIKVISNEKIELQSYSLEILKYIL